MTQEYPITAVLGNRGGGKTLFMTFLAVQAQKNGKAVYSNFDLYGVDYNKITFKELSTLPEHLNNALVLTDEMHMGADAYDFLKKDTRAFATFATQLRKRKVYWFYTTQIFSQVAKRVRNQTDYIISTSKVDKAGIFKLEIYDRSQAGELLDIPIKSFLFDGKPYFEYYDTNQVIQSIVNDSSEKGS